MLKLAGISIKARPASSEVAADVTLGGHSGRVHNFLKQKHPTITQGRLSQPAFSPILQPESSPPPSGRRRSSSHVQTCRAEAGRKVQIGERSLQAFYKI